MTDDKFDKASAIKRKICSTKDTLSSLSNAEGVTLRYESYGVTYSDAISVEPGLVEIIVNYYEEKLKALEKEFEEL